MFIISFNDGQKTMVIIISASWSGLSSVEWTPSAVKGARVTTTP
jgi:hypothetical protein